MPVKLHELWWAITTYHKRRQFATKGQLFDLDVERKLFELRKSIPLSGDQAPRRLPDRSWKAVPDITPDLRNKQAEDDEAFRKQRDRSGW
jgi:hypothetical protein